MSSSIYQSILTLIAHHGVPIVALLVFAGELGLPTGIPVEIALLLAGSYALHSAPGLLTGLVLVIAADVSGTTLLHLAVRTGGVRLVSRFLRRQEGPPDEGMDRWRRRFGGHDAAVVFVGRLLPLVRMPVSIGAGLLRIRLRDFIAGAIPAAALWAGIPLTLGYFFRADVGRFEARYTRFSHITLIALPALSLATALAWWIRGGRTARATLRRGRTALGVVAATVTVGYLVKTAWANESAAEHGRIALPAPLLAAWLTVLGILALGLLAIAMIDLRAARRTMGGRGAVPRSVATEIATTVAWTGLVAILGIVVTVIERRYPVL